MVTYSTEVRKTRSVRYYYVSEFYRPSHSLLSHPLGSLSSLIFFALSILFFAFYPTKEPGPRLGEELNRKEIEATYAAAKKSPEKNSGLYRIQIFYICN